ncbi:hypothetical protein MTO96_032724 [Rhipicephalus appendiculatus]
MESEEDSLYKGRRYSEDETEKGFGRYWISLVTLVLVGLGLLCTALLCGVLFPDLSGVEITTADTLAAFHVPKTPTPRITLPSDEPGRVDANTSLPPIAPGLIPSNHPISGECAWGICHTLAYRMRSKLDFNVDPCQDFYKYVCSKFRGRNEFRHLEKEIRLSSMRYLLETKIPPSNQLSRQKAAAMFNACLVIAAFSLSETPYLVEWMKTLNLDLVNETRLAAVNPVEIMVRGSLDLGVEAVIAITFDVSVFVFNKRRIQIEYSRQQDMWRAQKRSVNDYVHFLAMYGAKDPLKQELASKIKAYERELEDIAESILRQLGILKYVLISELGQYTEPYVISEEWVALISRYTNGTYGGSDRIVQDFYGTNILVELFQRKTVGIRGLRYLVAWTFFRYLVEFTEPSLFLRGRTVSDACYEHVKKVMNLAFSTPYFYHATPQYMLSRTKVMVSRIRKTYEEVLNSSSWVNAHIRAEALNKLIDMTIYVGGAGRRLDPEFIEDVYKPYPDAPLDRLFPTWIKALSFSAHEPWADQKYPLYDESVVNAEYHTYANLVIITTGMMHDPFLYPYGPLALNYGGLGMIIAHEITHAFDVTGIETLNKSKRPEELRLFNEFKEEYTKRALCFRHQHKSILSAIGHHEALNDTADSENLADIVGTVIAYAAFDSLPPKNKRGILAGIDMSPEQLFFINYCVKWCAEHSTQPPNYAPFRSRCIVPLMNMPEFSTAFRCAAGSPMNPRKKCTIW